LKETTSKDTNTTTFKEALCSEKYRKTTFLSIIMALSMIFNGVFLITSFGATVFEIIYEGSKDDNKDKAQQTLNLISYFDPTAQLFAIFIVPRFTRRTLMMIGYALVALNNMAIAVADLKDHDTIALIMLVLLAVVTSIS
jgi:Sugar (and other) transporter